MTFTDWIIDIALVLIVLRQMREVRLDRRFFLLPLGIVGYTASHYLTSFPTGGNDLVLLGACLAAGTTLGAVGGLITYVRDVNGVSFARAGYAAAGLWVANMGARLGFIIWITHSAGAASLTRFSVAHHITGGDVWQTALVLLALSEVLVRLGVIGLRGQRCAAASRNGVTPAATTDRMLVAV